MASIFTADISDQEIIAWGSEEIAGEVAWHGDTLKQKWTCKVWFANGGCGEKFEWREVPKFNEDGSKP